MSLNAVVTVESSANPNTTIKILAKIDKAIEVGVDDLTKWL